MNGLVNRQYSTRGNWPVFRFFEAIKSSINNVNNYLIKEKRYNDGFYLKLGTINYGFLDVFSVYALPLLYKVVISSG